MAKIDTIVIGVSSVGILAVRELLSLLPTTLPASISIVLESSNKATRSLPTILNQTCKSPVSFAMDGEITHPGHVYLAPSETQMLLRCKSIELAEGYRSQESPSFVDTLFCSAARNRRRRVIAVLMTDLPEGGVLGLSAIRGEGGFAIAQHPDEAMFADMPQIASERQVANEILPIRKIAERLRALVGTECPEDANIACLQCN